MVSSVQDLAIEVLVMAERYESIKWVGGGGYADVYEAVDTVAGRTVAKKVLRDKTPDNLRRFRRERNRLDAYRTNPNVVDLLDSDLDADKPYLILEYSELGSLEKYVKNRQDWRQIVKWMRDIAKALTAIHAGGHWHRDIKPSNILLFRDANGNIIAKITDFGLAPKSDNSSGTMTNSPHGTKGYIDPIAHLFGFSAPSDIYSLGKTLKELLTGDKDNGIYPTDIPFQLHLLVERMMSFSRDYRPTAEKIYEAAYELLQPQQPVFVPTQPVEPLGWKGWLTLAGIGLGIFALANTNSYDENVGRYRDSNGRFTSGMFF